MPQPTEYQPETTFWSFEMTQSWFPGHQLDAEFANLDITLTEILANLALIQRDDGALANESVGFDQLTVDLRGAINALTAGNITAINAALAEKQTKLLPNVKDFGAVGDGVANDTAAITTANAAVGAKGVPAGVFVTTLAATDLDGPYFGFGQIKTGANKRAPFFSAIKAAPASFGAHDGIDTAFNGDVSKSQFQVEHRITGAATLGQPSSGYVYTPEAYPHYTWLFNSSGFNNATGSNDGRTAACAHRVHVQNAGQGDCVAFNATGVVSGTRAGSTSFLANPAVSLFNGDVFGATDGVYLNPGEFSLSDLGFDVAGIGWVVNLNRSVATGAKGAFWSGFRVQSTGSADVNSAFSAGGKFDVGLDFSAITTDASKAAVALKGDDRIYLNSSSSNGFFATALGSVYFGYRSTGVAGVDLVTPVFNIVGSSNQHSEPALVLVNNDTGTPAGAGGSIYWQGPNSVGAQKNGALINAGLVVATNGAEQGLFDFHVLRNGADVVGLTLSAQVAALLSAVGWDLGTTGFPWGSVFLKSGAVLNLANGDVTITHASNTLTFAGAATGYVFDSTISGAALTLTGLFTGGATILTGNGVSTGDVNIELGGSRSGSGNCYIDFHATSGSDYESRFIRASGTNGAATFSNKGTGDFSFVQEGVGNIIFSTQSINRFKVESSAYAVDIPDASGVYKVNGTQVVKSRVTGYTAFTGTNTNRATAYDTATITLVQLAERVRAFQVDLTAHGLIGA